MTNGLGMVKRDLEPRPPWTFEVGPSGFHLERGPQGSPDYISLYIDLGQISRILIDGQRQWGEEWRRQLANDLNRIAVRDRGEGE